MNLPTDWKNWLSSTSLCLSLTPSYQSESNATSPLLFLPIAPSLLSFRALSLLIGLKHRLGLPVFSAKSWTIKFERHPCHPNTRQIGVVRILLSTTYSAAYPTELHCPYYPNLMLPNTRHVIYHNVRHSTLGCVFGASHL